MQEFVSVPLAQLRELFGCVDDLRKQALVNASFPEKTKQLINRTAWVKQNLNANIKEG